MKKEEHNFNVISNFIDYFTSNEDERKAMKATAENYTKEDHVDGEPADNVRQLPTTMTAEMFDYLLNIWKQRRKGVGYNAPVTEGKYEGTFGRENVQSKMSGVAELEFFIGATAMLDYFTKAEETGSYSIPPGILIPVMQGESIEYAAEKIRK